MIQLNLFDNQPNGGPEFGYGKYIAGGGFIFQSGKKNADFVVFNPMGIEFTNEKPALHKIILKDDKFWNGIKSMAWSSNCRYFIVVNTNHIIIGNTQNNKAVLSDNLSFQVFEDFLKLF